MLESTQVAEFDDRNITWRTLDWLEHVSYFVYAIDERNRIVDVMFKFAPNERVMLHQHKVPYYTLVLQGELRFYRPNGELKETRATGSYVLGVANGEPHTEGAGDQEAIVFFSNRDVEGDMYEFLDEPVRMLGIADFKEQLDDQMASGVSAKAKAPAKAVA